MPNLACRGDGSDLTLAGDGGPDEFMRGLAMNVWTGEGLASC